jgi:vacuolar-type H+-ATPase subunit F/Vma7
MGRIVAIGEEARTHGFGLAGCGVVTAADPEAIRRAWSLLAADVDLVILTPSAAAALTEELAEQGAPLVAVMPE